MPLATAGGPPSFTPIEGEHCPSSQSSAGSWNHGALCLVATNDIAAVEQVVEQRSGPCTGIED
jgi:hypothetical protein